MNYETMTRDELSTASVAAWNDGKYELSDEIETIIARRFPFDESKYKPDLSRYAGCLAPIDNSDILKG